MEKNTRYGIFLIGAFSLLILSALVISGSQGNIKVANNDESLQISNSYSIPLYTYEDLSNNSDYVFMGAVKEVLPSKWNSIDGKKPNVDVEVGPYNLIYTDVIISVDENLKNSLSSKEVRVRVEGGTVGNDIFTAEDEPSFKVGEKVLLYLNKDTSPGTKDVGPEHFKITGFRQGKFTLNDDGKAIRGAGENTITLNELLSTIKQ
jgi:hypothetical protein